MRPSEVSRGIGAGSIWGAGRAFRIRAVVCCLVLLHAPAVDLRAQNPSETTSAPPKGDAPPEDDFPNGPGSYCGVHCLYRALQYFQKDVKFGDLVSPKYIGSRKGSSIQELATAAHDFGLQTRLLSGGTCAMLRQADTPMLLHVKVDFASKEYNHWILFMGTEDGQARIYDGVQPVQAISFEELASRWDGKALIVSDQPISSLAPLYYSVPGYITSFGIAGVSLAGLFWLWLRFRRAVQGLNVRRGTLVLLEGGVVILLSAVAGVLSLVLPGGGLASYDPAVAEIQHSHRSTFVPHIKAEEIARLVESAGATFVDARLSKHFAVDHIKGSVNVPPYSPPAKYQQLLADVDPNRKIVVYCYSSGCPYSDDAVRTLYILGYRNVSLFRGGWDEWEDFRRRQAR